jgi:SAM-dependent methyltransferase
LVESNYEEARLSEFAFASRKIPEFVHFRMVRCPTCDLLYASPAPDAETVRERYREAPFDAGTESRHAAHTYARLLRSVLAELPDRSTALDIGAGDGAFLERLLEAGFSRVVGVEPSRAPVEQARPEIRPLISQSFFGNGDFERESLSLVTCFQTLEHADDPGGLCTAAYALLKPGGAFCTVAHNYRSVQARMLGSRSPIYDVEHMQLYSPRSLRFMLERCGFQRISVSPIRNDYPLSYWVKLLPLQLGLKERLLSGLRKSRLGDLPVPAWAGNVMAFGYRPRKPAPELRAAAAAAVRS